MALDLNDKTGNANHLTNNGAAEDSSPPFASPNTTDALFASADSDFMSAVDASSLKPTGNFSVQLWLKTTSTPTSGYLFQVYADVTNPAGFVIAIDGNGAIQFFKGNNAGSNADLRSATAINNNAWRHICCTYDGSNMRIYIDGSSTADATLASTVNAAYQATSYPRLGCYNGSGTNGTFLNGQLDEVRLWNTAISGATNNTNYNSRLLGTETNLQAYYPFESLVETPGVDMWHPAPYGGYRFKDEVVGY